MFACADDYAKLAAMLTEWAAMASNLLDKRFQPMTTLSAFDIFFKIAKARRRIRGDTERSYVGEVFETVAGDVDELYEHYHVRHHEASMNDVVDGDDPRLVNLIEKSRGLHGIISGTKIEFTKEVHRLIADVPYSGQSYTVGELMQNLVQHWREEYVNMARLAELRLIAVASTIKNEQSHRHIKELKGNKLSLQYSIFCNCLPTNCFVYHRSAVPSNWHCTSTVWLHPAKGMSEVGPRLAGVFAGKKMTAIRVMNSARVHCVGDTNINIFKRHHSDRRAGCVPNIQRTNVLRTTRVRQAQGARCIEKGAVRRDATSSFRRLVKHSTRAALESRARARRSRRDAIGSYE